MRTITASDLARHTSKILDQVVGEGGAIVVERNHRPVARLIPAHAPQPATQALRGLYGLLSEEAAAEWLKDSRHDLDDSVRDPWA